MASEIIQSRDDFFRVLDEAIRLTSDRLRQNPKDENYQSVEMQLDAMWRWTRDGRTPTDDERQSITIGRIAVREFEPAETPEEYDYNNYLHELNYYFENWPDDPEVAAEDPPLD
jgi:hypothetical protein